jgi:hypothetical protein
MWWYQSDPDLPGPNWYQEEKDAGPFRVGIMRGAELPGFGYVKIFSRL